MCGSPLGGLLGQAARESFADERDSLDGARTPVARDARSGYLVRIVIEGVTAMRMKSAIQAAAAALLAAACSTEPLAINSLAFEKRAPLPGQMGYLETIKYIDDGIKYIDPSGEFFVSYNGDMCFRGQ